MLEMANGIWDHDCHGLPARRSLCLTVVMWSAKFSVVFVTAVSICKYSKQMFYKISAIVTVIYTITPTLTSIISFLYSSKIL